MRTGSTDQIELLLLRHGATPSNAEGRYLGRTNESLAEAGRQELQQKKEKYEGLNPDIVFSGPMARCRETAELLFEVQPVTIPEWTEIDFGAFEMKNYHDLDGNPDYQAWIDSGGTLPFPGGESREEFISRSMQGLDRMLSVVSALCDAESAMDDGERNDPGRAVPVAAVVHSGTIMSIMSTLTGGEYYDFHTKNGEGYRLCLTTDEAERPVLLNYKST